MQQKVAYMFPGQGAQHPNMGLGLFETYPFWVERAEEILGYDLPLLCSSGDGRLDDTRYTQPALFVVNHLHLLERLERAPEPDYVLGHSLGEYNALVAAGIFEFEDALKLVCERGRLMAQYATGGMVALMKLDMEQIRAVLDCHPRGSEVDVANINSKQQIVIAAPRDVLDAVATALMDAGGFVVPLKVSGGFHSRLMEPAVVEFAEVVAETPQQEGRLPVISNVTARPHDMDALKLRLCDHIVMPVQWQASVEYLLEQENVDFHEVGVGATLTGLQRYIVKDFEARRAAD